jgi:hypothetical protein
LYGSAPFHLRAREVSIAIIHRLELAAVDRNARIRKQTHLAAEFDKARAQAARRVRASAMRARHSLQVDPSVWMNGRVDPKLLDPVCRLSGSGYASLGDLVNVLRPQWKNIEGTVGMDAMPRAERR